MATIYTISHPFTNEVVYVGCTDHISARTSCHFSSKNQSPISQWICSLKENYMYPKVEVLEIVPKNDSLYLEKYWISQLTAWGFNLLNVLKMPKAKKNIQYVKKSEALPTGDIVKVRKSKVWGKVDFKIGSVHKIALKKRAIFVICFNTQRKILGIDKVYLDFKREGNSLIGIVRDGKKPTLPKHTTKNGLTNLYRPHPRPKVEKVKNEPKILRFHINNLEFGGKIIVPIEKWISFKNSTHQSFPNIFYNFELSEDKTNVIVTKCEHKKDVVKNKIPQSLTRPNKKSGR